MHFGTQLVFQILYEDCCHCKDLRSALALWAAEEANASRHLSVQFFINIPEHDA